MADFYGELVGTYTSRMDAMGLYHLKHSPYALCIMAQIMYLYIYHICFKAIQVGKYSVHFGEGVGSNEFPFLDYN